MAPIATACAPTRPATRTQVFVDIVDVVFKCSRVGFQFSLANLRRFLHYDRRLPIELLEVAVIVDRLDVQLVKSIVD